MSANKTYLPAYIGGKIQGVQLTIQNNSGDDVATDYRNGIYYAYQGNDFQLLSAGVSTIEAGHTAILTEQLFNTAVPSSDIKLMIDTAGLVGCTITALIFWGVE